jgi:hypothetical protein
VFGTSAIFEPLRLNWGASEGQDPTKLRALGEEGEPEANQVPIFNAETRRTQREEPRLKVEERIDASCR